MLHYIGSICAVFYFAQDGLLLAVLMGVAMLGATPILWPWESFFGGNHMQYVVTWKDRLLEYLFLGGVGLLMPVGLAAVSIGCLFQ
jgi:hypothetical protein